MGPARFGASTRWRPPDDPVHAVHRKILLPHLSARRISVIEEFAAQTAQRLWSDSVADGRVEWMGAVAEPAAHDGGGPAAAGYPTPTSTNSSDSAYAATSVLDGVVMPAPAGASRRGRRGCWPVTCSTTSRGPHELRRTDLHGATWQPVAPAGELAEAPALTIMITLFSAARRVHCLAAWAVRRGSWLSPPEVQRRVRDDPESAGRVHRGGAAL